MGFEVPNKYRLIWIFCLFFFKTMASAKMGDTILRMVVMAEFEELNPLLARLPGSKYLLGFTSRPLIHMGRHGELVSDVLESIPAYELENYSEEKLHRTVALKLKEQVFWADGSNLTSKDIHYTLTKAKSAIATIPNGSIYSKLENIIINPAAPREMTFIFNSDEPHLIQQLVNFRIIPSPKLKQETLKKGFDPLDQRNYNGPYFVSSFERGKSISLMRNKFFNNNPSNIERIEIVLHFHQGIIEKEIKNKSLDLLPSPGFKPEFAYRLKDIMQTDQSFRVLSADSNRSVQLILSTQFDILGKQKVRKALSLALPRFDSNGTIANQLKSSNSSSETDLVFKLFAEAGWVIKNKALRDKNGNKFKVTLAVTNTPREMRELAEHIRLNWEQVGVEVNIKSLERKRFLSRSLKLNQKKTMVPLFTLQAGPKHERSKLRRLLAGNFTYDEWTYQRNLDRGRKPFNDSESNTSPFQIKLQSHKFLDQIMADNLDQETVFLKLFNLPKVAIVSSKINGLVLQSSSFPESYHSTLWSLGE